MGCVWDLKIGGIRAIILHIYFYVLDPRSVYDLEYL